MANPKNAVFVAVDPFIGVPAPASATGTNRLFPLGLEARFEDKQTGTAYKGAGKFVYAQGSNVTAAGQVVHLSNNSAVLLASANSASFFPVGVAAGALSATNVYGWVQVQGICDYLLQSNSSCAAGVPLYMAATAGLVLSNTAAGQKVIGVCPNVSFTSADTYMQAQLHYPQLILVSGATGVLSVGGI